LTNTRAKIYGKTVLNEEIPVNKFQKKINHVEGGGNDVHYIKVQNRFNVKVSLRSMNKTPKGSTLDFFQKTFFQNLSC